MRISGLEVTVNEVHDGDNIYGFVDHGCGIWNHGKSSKGVGLRIDRINARELAEPGGIEARDHLASLFPVGAVFTFTSVRLDKYSGRLDVEITLPDGRDLATVLVAEQWAAWWDGKGSRADHVPPWPRVV